jgi:hypothetical protein
MADTPLGGPWVLWEVRCVPGAQYTEAVHPVGVPFATLAAFWAHWARLPRLAEVFSDGSRETRNGVLRTWPCGGHGGVGGVDSGDGGDSGGGVPAPETVVLDGFAVFREGVRPEWEDPQNRTGGEWGCRKGAVPRLRVGHPLSPPLRFV